MSNAIKDYSRIKDSGVWLKDHGFKGAQIALVLGSGLGGLAGKVENAKVIGAAEIPGYPASSVEGHQGRILLGELSGVKCLVFAGRVHYYEGYSPVMICAPVIVAHLLGIETVILTNAAGSLNGDFQPGSLMVVEDIISIFHHDPVIGLVRNLPRGGARNLDRPLCPDYMDMAVKAAVETGTALHRGVYGALTGPTYESRAEVRMLQYMGADAAGMSTAPEIIMANYLGMKTLAISCLTNLGTGLSPTPLTHDEVQEVAGQAAESFEALMLNIIGKIGRQHFTQG